QPDHLPLRHVEGQVVDRDHLAEHLAQIADLDGVVAHGAQGLPISDSMRSMARDSRSGALAKHSRRKPSPPWPKAMPGATPTLASVTRRLAKARLSVMPSTAKKA